MKACTIIARNYLPFARVLARSFQAKHRDASFFVLVIDDEDRRIDEAHEPFHVLRPSGIGLTRQELHQMAMMYDVTEMSTAVKPILLTHLSEAYGSSVVIYLDPDIWVHAPLDGLEELAHERGIILTPHRTVPLITDNRTPTERDILSAGAFNLGFIALGPGSEEFLRWWSERLSLDAIRDVANDLFTDQRWIDLVPGYFRHFVLRDEAYNVAYWNLDSRDVAWTGEQYEVNGASLRFFHFSGFDPDNHDLLTKHHAASPRILLSQRPVIARLCEDYARNLREAGYTSKSEPYGYDVLPNGIPVDRFMRRSYRNGILKSQSERVARPADGFDPDQVARFMDWLNDPVDSALFARFAARPRVSRYLYQLYLDHGDLRMDYPSVPGRDTSAFVDWVANVGKHQLRLPEKLIPARVESKDPSRTDSSELLEGLNVAGYFRAEMGTGEAGRLTAAAVEGAGIPVSTLVLEHTVVRQEHPFKGRETTAPIYDTNLLCVNADQVPLFAQRIGREFFDRRYTIGLWHWEVEKFPSRFLDSFDYVDEVWTASEFARKAVAELAPCPVFAFPLPVAVPYRPKGVQGSLSNGRFTFLFVFDFFSVFDRKNPLGLIDAFRAAFRSNEGPVLIIKSVNGVRRPDELERLRAAAEKHTDIVLIEDYMSVEDKQGLMAACDCYVSLHRSEGFGITMAEAMNLGKPVIATGYSGNLEFMTEANSFLVPYTLVPIGPGCDPYPASARWAAPDIEAAARLMRDVYENPTDRQVRGERGRADILELHSPRARAEFIRERYNVRRLRHGRTVVRELNGRSYRRRPPVFRRPARALLRLLARPAAALHYAGPRWRRPAATLRRVFHRPYRALLQASGGFRNPNRRQGS